MSSDFPVPADKLKKLIKQSLRMPIPFGFNPGLSEDNDEYLAAHPRKAPEMLGKLALSEGEGTKSAFGTFALSDSELHLTCFRVVPQLAKRFKRYLKAAKIQLNVVVMDENGITIDSDIEDLKEVFGLDDDEAETVEDEAEGAAPPPAAAPATRAAPQRARSIDPAVAAAAALSDRLKALQPKVLSAPPPVAQKLGTLFKTAVAQVREGKLKEGAAAIASLETTFAKIGKGPAGAAPAPAVAAPARDSRLPKLREALVKLEDRAEALLGDGAEMILGDLEMLAPQIDLGEADAVMKALREIQSRVAALAAAKAKWVKTSRKLAPKVERAVSAGAAPALRSRWKLAVGLAEVGDWPRALAALPGIIGLLKEAPPADPARLKGLWAAASAGAKGPAASALAEIGVRLAPVLEAIGKAPDPAGRKALQKQAAGLVAEARRALAA